MKTINNFILEHLSSIDERLKLNDESKITQNKLNENYIMFIINGQNSIRRKISILYLKSILDTDIKLQILGNKHNKEWLFICDIKYEADLKRALKDTIKNSGNEIEINFVTILNNKYKTISELQKAIKNEEHMQYLKFTSFRG